MDRAYITLQLIFRELCLRWRIADLPALAGRRERETRGRAPTCLLVGRLLIAHYGQAGFFYASSLKDPGLKSCSSAEKLVYQFNPQRGFLLFSRTAAYFDKEIRSFSKFSFLI